MTTDLTDASSRVCAAADYTALFGTSSGDNDAQAQLVKAAFRELALVLHPDRYSDAADKATAEAAFIRLHQLYTEALKALEHDVYGQTAPLATITTRRAEHQLLRTQAGGDLCDCYMALTTSKGEPSWRTIVKITRDVADNDLLKVEAAALKHLRGPDGDPKRYPFIPELVDSFAYSEPHQAARSVNVLAMLDGFCDLTQVNAAYPSGIDPRDMAWIWRRLLLVLGYAHSMGVIHGAVLPQHVMILPEQHGLVLVDWCYSVRENVSYPPIKAIAETYRTWYPYEVLQKQPPSAATDIALAARCMVWLMGGNPVTGNVPDTVPRALRAFFKGCLATGQTARPDDAWQLLGEFDELLEQMGEPFYPRRFHVFSMRR